MRACLGTRIVKTPEPWAWQPTLNIRPLEAMRGGTLLLMEVCQGKFAVCSKNGTHGRKHLITQAERDLQHMEKSLALFQISNMLPGYGDRRLPTELLYGARLGVYFV